MVSVKLGSLHFSHMVVYVIFFFFNDTATTEIYTLSLHDALPISPDLDVGQHLEERAHPAAYHGVVVHQEDRDRSEEHTSELQSRENLVCRLLLEKKKKKHQPQTLQPAPQHPLPQPSGTTPPWSPP